MSPRARHLLLLAVVLSVFGCKKRGGELDIAAAMKAVYGSAPAPGDGPAVTFIVDGRVKRVPVTGDPVDLGARLDRLGKGEDESPAVSRNGSWLTVVTNRVAPCSGWACLAVVRGDVKAAVPVIAGGEPVRAQGRAAISDDGTVVVYAAEGGPHSLDLFLVRRDGSRWSDPQLLTGGSQDDYNQLPVLHRSGERVLHDCGPDPYSQNGTNICETSVADGTTRKVVDSAHPQGKSGTFLVHHADYERDDSLVFEADWESEQIWRRKRDGSVAVVQADVSNDNSPCVIPGAGIASLWLGRPGGSGTHELKLALPDGSHRVLTPGIDIADVGMSCHL